MSLDQASEHHRSHRVGWLRAAVLGANDGIVSTSSLVIGVAASGASHSAVMTAGVAGAIAGAMAMATGEYVSVSSQRDTELADVQMEQAAIESDHVGEMRELAKIYEHRGVEPGLARLVAEQLMAHDSLGAHLRDELGISEMTRANPLQAAWTSALSFAAGALLPLLAVALSPRSIRVVVIAAVALVALVVLGVVGARAGGAPARRAAARIVFWSSCAMAFTWAVGHVVGATVS